MYVYRNNPARVGVYTTDDRRAVVPRYFIEVDGNGGGQVRIDMSRERAMSLRRELNMLLRITKPVSK